MEVILDLSDRLLDPDWIMKRGGLYLVLLIIFIETGFFFGFFLPGDPLLFISGMIIAGANEILHPFGSEVFNLMFWGILFIIAAVVGNFAGYWFGHKFDHLLLNRKKDSWFFKQKHVESARQFYAKKGGFAIFIARFLPVVRTFVPIVGGMVKMNFKSFALYNILGAITWVVSITSLGFILGENAWVKNNLEVLILALVLIVTLPVLFKMLTKKKPAAHKEPRVQTNESPQKLQ